MTAAGTPVRVSHTLRGTVLMVAATACASLLQVSTREMPGAVQAPVIVFWRSAFGMVWLVPWVLWQGRGALRTSKPQLHALRAVLNLGSMSLFFAGVTRAPLAQVAVIGFTSPLFGALLVVLLLREACPPRRWVAMGIGLAATALVVRPQGVEWGTGPLLLLGGELFWGFVLVTVKMLSRSDSSLTIITYLTLFLTPLAAIPAAFFWIWPTPEQLAWLALIAALGTASQFLMTQSFRDADVTAVVPLTFTELIWSALLGWLLFGETPDAWTLVGGLAIFASSAYLTVREGR
jgi:drug/metabolite transporter (DMT)-like permease